MRTQRRDGRREAPVSGRGAWFRLSADERAERVRTRSRARADHNRALSTLRRYARITWKGDKCTATLRTPDNKKIRASVIRPYRGEKTTAELGARKQVAEQWMKLAEGTDWPTSPSAIESFLTRPNFL